MNVMSIRMNVATFSLSLNFHFSIHITSSYTRIRLAYNTVLAIFHSY